MSISIIVPSVGRKTLVNTLLSIIPQLGPSDEIVVVMDGYSAPEITALSPQITYLEIKKTNDYGNSARDAAIQAAKGTHLAFCDDDDILSKDAFTVFRKAISLDHQTPWVFRMRYAGPHPSTPEGLILWQEPVIRPTNVGTPMMLVPNGADLPKWKIDKNLEYSDYIWIDKINKMWHNDLRFDSSVVCLVRPDDETLKEEGLL